VRWNGSIEANLPGMACVEAGDAVACRSSDEPWPLGSSRPPLLAGFAPGRNYFDGRIVMPSGVRKTVPPFYSAAPADDGGRPVWVLATVEGGAQIFDAALDPIGPAGNWGSDIAGTDVRCAGRSVVLATRPGDGSTPDAVRAYAIVNRAAVPLGAPSEFPGPVTALVVLRERRRRDCEERPDRDVSGLCRDGGVCAVDADSSDFWRPARWLQPGRATAAPCA
jgi:hypothetical protein